VPLVAISHRMARLVIIGADDGFRTHVVTDTHARVKNDIRNVIFEFKEADISLVLYKCELLSFHCY
jgi:hypothetical protein